MTRIDPGVVSIVTELRGHQRQAADKLEQWKTGVEERKPLDASPPAITLAMICTREQVEEMERKALKLEKSRGADDQVDQLSHALNRLRAMVSLPKYSRPMPRPPTGGPRMDGVIGWSGIRPERCCFRVARNSSGTPMNAGRIGGRYDYPGYSRARRLVEGVLTPEVNHDVAHVMMSTVAKVRLGKTVSTRGRGTAVPSPPSDLIIWTYAQDWHQKVERLLSDHLTVSVKRRLRAMDPDCFYSDDLIWLEQASGDDPLGYCLDQVLADALHTWRVRTYHACRPRDVQSYFNLGLRCLRADEAVQELRRLVGLHDRLSVLRDESALAAALARVETDGRTGRVFVGLDNRDLLEGAGHYLIYGSEFLSAVLVQTGGCEFQNLLKLEGIPTVFVIDLPISLMRGSDVGAFARVLLSRWATNLATGRRTASDEDFTFEILCDVPPTCIVDHYHPARVCDPLHQLEPYVSTVVSCPRCVRQGADSSGGPADYTKR